MAKEILDEMARTGKSPADIVQDKGMSQISDPEEIRKAQEAVAKQGKVK